MERESETERTIGGRGLQGTGPRSRTFGRGRLCGEPGCGTRLSIYNDGSFCSHHQAKITPRMLGTKVVVAHRVEQHA